MFFCEEQKKKTTVNNSVYYTFAALGEKNGKAKTKMTIKHHNYSKLSDIFLFAFVPLFFQAVPVRIVNKKETVNNSVLHKCTFGEEMAITSKRKQNGH